MINKIATSRITVFYFGLIAAILVSIFSCNSNHKTLNNSQDTTSVNKAGGPPIADTATIAAQRKAAKDSGKADTTARGNVSPTGH
jgi:hypothetical protein